MQALRVGPLLDEAEARGVEEGESFGVRVLVGDFHVDEPGREESARSRKGRRATELTRPSSA